jgi:hypothetical protein
MPRYLSLIESGICNPVVGSSSLPRGATQDKMSISSELRNLIVEQLRDYPTLNLNLNLSAGLSSHHTIRAYYVKVRVADTRPNRVEDQHEQNL